MPREALTYRVVDYGFQLYEVPPKGVRVINLDPVRIQQRRKSWRVRTFFRIKSVALGAEAASGPHCLKCKVKGKTIPLATVDKSVGDQQQMNATFNGRVKLINTGTSPLVVCGNAMFCYKQIKPASKAFCKKARQPAAGAMDVDSKKEDGQPGSEEDQNEAADAIEAVAQRDEAMQVLSAMLKKMRSLLRHEFKIGGGEGKQGFYGSLTDHSTELVINMLKHHGGMGRSSTFLDIGAGICRPQLHAMVDPGVERSFGFEFDDVKVDKANNLINHVYEGMSGSGMLPVGVQRPEVLVEDIRLVRELPPGTHGYSFWQGWDPKDKKAFARLFNQCPTLKFLVVVQHSVKDAEGAMTELGFEDVQLVHQLSVTMQGSRSRKVAYLFAKKNE